MSGPRLGALSNNRWSGGTQKEGSFHKILIDPKFSIDFFKNCSKMYHHRFWLTWISPILTLRRIDLSLIDRRRQWSWENLIAVKKKKFMDSWPGYRIRFIYFVFGGQRYIQKFFDRAEREKFRGWAVSWCAIVIDSGGEQAISIWAPITIKTGLGSISHSFPHHPSRWR
jgi:hypothetical protein